MEDGSSSKVAEVEEKPSAAVHASAETVIIFDWDDTLMSSSWLAQNGLRLDEPAVVPPAAMKQLAMLEASVIPLLRRAKTHGHVCIITNAETGWVEMSAKRFMPGVLPHLEDVHVLSARSTYEPRFPDSPSDWKLHAFFQKICDAYGAFPADIRKNVLSFGDSIHERHAIHKVMTRVTNANTKSIKFVERPTLEQLKRQVDLISSCFDDIATHKGDLDLMLTIQLLYS